MVNLNPFKKKKLVTTIDMTQPATAIARPYNLSSTGFTSTTERDTGRGPTWYDEGTGKLPPNSSEYITKKGGGGGSSGGGGGTYNPNTGVYINPQGQGFSTQTAPQGATITTTSKPSLSSQQLSYARKEQGGYEDVIRKKKAPLLYRRVPSKKQIVDFTIGETGKKYIGVGVLGTKAFVSGQQVKTFTQENAGTIYRAGTQGVGSLFNLNKPVSSTGTFTVQTLAEVIPTTPLDVAMTGVGGSYTKLPIIARVPISAGATYFGSKGALDSALSPQQRVASGIGGVLGGTGLVFETIPYVRGKSLVSEVPYSPTKPQEIGFKAIEIPQGETIGLIPRGSPLKEGVTTNVKLPSTSPLKRGGFSVKQSEKNLFVGKNQILATSQISLFKKGMNVKIERPFYTTSQEPFIKIPETRVSRLGLNEGLFNIPKSSQIGFGVPGKAQIGIIKSNVGFKENYKTFQIGKGSELEAIKTYGTITNVKKIGYTNINLQGVEIYSFDISKGVKTNLNSLYKGTSYSGTRVSGESILGIGSTRLKTTEIKPTAFVTSSKLLTTIPITKTTLVTTPKLNLGTTTIKTNRTTSKGTTYTTPTIKTMYPNIPTTKLTTITKPIKPIRTPPTKPQPYPPINPPRFPQTKTPIRTNFSYTPKSKVGNTNFLVLMRRFGKFKPIGITKTSQEAFNLGKFKTGTTLGATFKVEGSTQQPTNIFGYKTKKTKKGIVFIEKPKFRLSTGTEKKEINYYRNLAKKIQSKGGNRL